MNLVGIPRNPVPAGAVDGNFTTFDGMQVRDARWKPPRRGRKGTVCVFPGRAEYIEKYFETVSDLRQRGFAAAMMDWRGQGGSSRAPRNPLKGHVDDFFQYDQDLAQFMNEIVLPDCTPPYFALAHSMGANILLRAACMRDCWFDRMMFSAPMIRLGGRAPALGIINAISQIAVFFGLGGLFVPGTALFVPGSAKDKMSGTESFENNLLTSDRRRYERNQLILEAAPRLGLGSPSISWACAATDSMKLINEFDFPPKVHVPILMAAAGRDQVVSGKAIDELAMQLKAGDRIVIDGARHEILQERDAFREQFWAAFDAFIPGSR